MLIPEASLSARLVDQAFLRTLVVELFFFIPITAAIIYFALKYYERRHPVAENIEGSTLLEVLWTTIPLMLCLVIFYIGLIGFDKIREIPKDAMPIKVVGQQWTWHFFYENGRETSELRVPVKKPIKLVLTSRDVIHSFFVPAFRIKEDCVPGMENYLSFTVEEPGTYDIFCTEYCGLGHSGMVAKIAAMEEKDFAAWYAAAPAAGEESGKELLEKNGCLGCHSTDGTPKVGPTYKGLYGSRVTVLTNGKERTITADDAYLRRSVERPKADVVKGFPDIMPSIPLRPAEVDAIVKYIKTLK